VIVLNKKAESNGNFFVSSHDSVSINDRKDLLKKYIYNIVIG